jgi:two-component system phosphate regulon sensor histidine kinase PhoR|tara:strand:+ start:506 stop:1795 length:1290 start_codon:yes stop_codon:yes gene_type:complete
LVRGFRAELKRVLVFAVTGIFFGFINGYMSWTLIAACAVYISGLLWQIRRLDLWLAKPNKQPPDASGIWGTIFDNIYRLQKKQRKEKRELKTVINRVQETTAALRDGVILIDSHGNIDWWNRAANGLLGFQSADQGHALINYLRHPQFIDYFESGDYKIPLDLPSPRFQGKQLQFQITAFGRRERLVVVRDITQIHQLENMRRDFVANVSHELRTPLTVIRGYLETLADSHDMPGQWQKPFSQMLSQSERMGQLVEDLISLSQLESKSSQQPQLAVGLVALLQSVRLDALELSGSKQQQIIIHGVTEVAIAGCEKSLRSAFSNLIFNAVKYTPSNSRIDLTLQKDEMGIHVSVQDNGAGFDSKHIPRLTERFYRVDDHRNSSTGGTGLGLAIVKHALLRHDAELKIESQLGQGSCFSCHFPLTRECKPI